MDCFAVFRWLRSAEVGIQIAATDKCAQDSHMFVNSDDIALFKVAFIPLIVEVKDHGDNLKD